MDVVKRWKSYRFARLKYLSFDEKQSNMEKKDLIEMQRKAFEEGVVLYNTCEGLTGCKI